VAVVRSDVSEERVSYIIVKVERISELGITLAVIIVSTLMMGAIHSSETSVLTRISHRHVPEDGILHSNRLKTFKQYYSLSIIYLDISGQIECCNGYDGKRHGR
jgi:hypothetical protein